MSPFALPISKASSDWLIFVVMLLAIGVGIGCYVIWLMVIRNSPPRKKTHGKHTAPAPPSAQPQPRRDRRAAAAARSRRTARRPLIIVMEQSRALTKKSASNLALAFILLPREKRDAMSALYAFCRAVDDVADEDSVPTEKRRTELAAWREDIRRACENKKPEFVLNQEFAPVIQKFKLPFALFDELIKGCEMDLEKLRYENYDELELYCHRVASVVGLLSIEIFGYKNPACHDYAVHLGKALQLTNILRDVKNDAARGRIYLPFSELKKFGVSEKEILDGQYSEKYSSLAQSVADRAKNFYALAQKTLPPEDRRAMVAAELMGSVYWRLLQKLEREKFNVFGEARVKLSKPHKLALIFQSWFRHATGAAAPGYGNF
jgi:phytoene synthase